MNCPNVRGDVAVVEREGFGLEGLEDVLRDLGWSIVPEESKPSNCRKSISK